MAKIDNQNNIILIGMPGCGKSSLGIVLAKRLGYGFIDADLLIQQREGMLLQDIIETKGLESFRTIEEEVNCLAMASRCVIATGGSAVYSEKAMEHFKSIGTVVYIKLPYNVIKRRVYNLEDRGIAMEKGQSFKELYEERIPLYEKYADLTVETKGMSVRKAVEKLVEELENYK